jgi:AcrR family transcriptional regulator
MRSVCIAYVIRKSVHHTQKHKIVLVENPTAEIELPEALQRLWRRSTHNRARARGLDLDRIVSAAIEIADAEGLAALSMARLAERLGSAPMSLYRHVTSKDELYDFMMDAVAQTLDQPTSDDWRMGLADWVADLIALFRRHPWILQLPVTRPPVDPGQLDWVERGLRVQQSTPLTVQERMAVVLALLGYARGVAALANSLDAADPSFGLPLPYGEVIARLIDETRFPALSAAVAAGVFEAPSTDPGSDIAADADFGLQMILDGIAGLIRSRTGVSTV